MAGVTDTMTELVLLGKQKVAVPLEFLEQWDVFSEVLSMTTWQSVLTEGQRQHLMKFLPAFPEKDKAEKEDTIRLLFSGKNFKFGNPLKLYHGKIKDGYLCPDIARYRRMVQKAKIKDYHVSQQQYYTKLLKQILVNRQRILEVIQFCPADHRLEVEWIPPPEVPKRQGLEAKVKAKYYSVLREVHDECGVDDSSSSDDEEKVTRSRKQLFKSPPLENGSENLASSVIPTFAPDPAGWASGGSAFSTPKTDFTEDDYRNLLRQHRKRRIENPDSSELVTAGLTLQDILFRTQPGSKHAKPQVSGGQPTSSNSTTPPKMKSHKKKKKVKDMSAADTSGGSDKLATPQSGLFVDENARDGTEDTPIVPEIKQEIIPRTPSACFLSVLRDSICSIPESKATTHKVEESVMQWQSSGVDAWAADRSDWMQLVLPSLKFLSGDVLGLPLEDFIPLLDYKERAQQWVWIGQGRDSDEQLTILNDLWLTQQDTLQAAGPIDGSASPQPPRIRTSFVVRPSSEEEKAVFRVQEKERFANPHKAFSYVMHGYQSVVGPVKGVYSKDNAMNKAREHALLVSDRPSYVTILTLVRDAAARLPNGEGTRSDICELLKDSSFLAPGVTDAQVNTVVSGALDRLHYEKDPCVKYEVNRKLWIYLHRNRTQEEFEKIHQAQGAAAKAKRALQKPKSQKNKDKDGVASTVNVAAVTETIANLTSEITAQSTGQTPPVTIATQSVKKELVYAATQPNVAQAAAAVQQSLLASQTPAAVAVATSLIVGQTASLSPPIISNSPGTHTTTTTTSLITTIANTISVTTSPRLAAGTVSSPRPNPRVTLAMPAVNPLSLGVASPRASPRVTLALPVSLPSGSTQNVLIHNPGSLLTSGGGTRVISISPSMGNTTTTSPSLVTTIPSSNVSVANPPPAVNVSPVVRSVEAQLLASLQASIAQSAKPLSVTSSVVGQQMSPVEVDVVSGGSSLPNTPTTAPRMVPLSTFQQGTTSLKIQGSNVVQAINTDMVQRQTVTLPQQASEASSSATPTTGAKPLTFTLCKSVLPSASGNKPVTLTITKSVSQSTTSGNKTTTVVFAKPGMTLGKPGTLPAGVSLAGQSIMTAKTQASDVILSGSHLAAQLIRAATPGGKPSTITGQPVLIDGKPAVITQIAGKPMRFAGKPTSLMNIVSQPMVINPSSSGAVQTRPLVNQATRPVRYAANIGQARPASIVSQMLQARPVASQAQSGAVKLTSSGQSATQKVLTPTQAGIMLTHLTQSPTSSKQDAGSAAPAQVITGPGGFAQIVMDPSKLVGGQHVLQAGARPTLLSTTTGQAIQGIHLLKTVISQPGNKPGQTAIVFSPQDAINSTSTSTSGKSAPVYARIITPPNSIRLAPVKQGAQGTAAQGILQNTVTQGVLQSQLAQGIIQAQAGQAGILNPASVIQGRSGAVIQAPITAGVIQAQTTAAPPSVIKQTSTTASAVPKSTDS